MLTIFLRVANAPFDKFCQLGKEEDRTRWSIVFLSHFQTNLKRNTLDQSCLFKHNGLRLMWSKICARNLQSYFHHLIDRRVTFGSGRISPNSSETIQTVKQKG